MARLTTKGLDDYLWRPFMMMHELGVPLADSREFLVGLIVLKAAVDRAEVVEEWPPALLLAPGRAIVRRAPCASAR